MTYYVLATQQGGEELMKDKCPTVTASAGMSGNNQPVVFIPERERLSTASTEQRSTAERMPSSTFPSRKR